jgi:hypothetical protein
MGGWGVRDRPETLNYFSHKETLAASANRNWSSNPQELNNVYSYDNREECKVTTELKPTEQEVHRPKVIYRGGASDAVYGLGLIGAWIYYLTHATTFSMGVLGLLKGIVWPAMLVYELLKYLNM